MSPEDVTDFIETHGIVLESARGPVPNIAELIAGEKMRGSWWGHDKAHDIFRITRLIRESPDMLVCRLVDGKITYVHRRLWPAVLRLGDDLDSSRTNALREVHTASGRHEVEETPIRDWMPDDVLKASAALSRADAIIALPQGLELR